MSFSSSMSSHQKPFQSVPASGVLWAELSLPAPPLLLQLLGQNPLLLQQPQVLLLPLKALQIPDHALVETLQTHSRLQTYSRQFWSCSGPVQTHSFTVLQTT